jgi:hypothetical protein
LKRGEYSNYRRKIEVSRFPAELTVTLTDGRSITECFNQAQMAAFMREAMIESLRKGQPIVVFDGERIEIEAQQVASVQVVVTG